MQKRRSSPSPRASRPRLPPSVLAELTRQAFEGVFMIEDGRVVYCNPSFARMAGYSVAEIESWSREQLQAIVHPDDRERMRTQYRDRVGGRSAPSQYDCRMVRPDGTVVWVRSFVAMAVGGGRSLLRLACIDITEQKRAEARLQESEWRCRAVVEQVAEAIFIVDRTGIVRQVNAAGVALLGHTRETVVGRALSSLFAVDELKLRPLDWPRLERGDVLSEIRALKSASGRHVIVDARLKLFDHESALITARDITDQRRIEGEILRVGMAERQRIGQALHDSVAQELAGLAYLATSLSKALADRSSPDAASAQEIAAVARHVMQDIRGIVQGLAPVWSGPDGFVSALTSMANVVRSVHGIPAALTVEGGGVIRDSAVTEHLYYVAQEAIANAVEHGRAKRIDIVLRTGRDDGTLIVTDDGVGFSPEARAASGMGLRIMMHRAGLMGGSLSLQSQPESGTSVSCSFCMQPPGGAAAPGPQQGIAPAFPG